MTDWNADLAVVIEQSWTNTSQSRIVAALELFLNPAMRVCKSHLHPRLVHSLGLFLHHLTGHLQDSLIHVELLLGADLEPPDAALL